MLFGREPTLLPSEAWRSGAKWVQTVASAGAPGRPFGAVPRARHGAEASYKPLDSRSFRASIAPQRLSDDHDARVKVMVGELVCFGDWRRGLAGSALVVAVSMSAGHAHASETFPPILAEKLGMPCVPNCLPCHLGPVGTAANQRFDGVKGEIERLANNDVREEDTLRAALDVIVMNRANLDFDSDGDEKQDLDELSDGENPYGGASLCETPSYGCFASHVAPELPTRFTALCLALTVAGALWWRRRR